MDSKLKVTNMRNVFFFLCLERRNGIVENTDYCPHISYFSLGVFLHFGCLAVVNVWAAAE